MQDGFGWDCAPARRSPARRAKGAAALNAAPQECLRRGGNDAEAWAPASHDRNINSEFIAPGDEFPRTVEGVDQNEAIGNTLRQRAARSLLRHDAHAG